MGIDEVSEPKKVIFFLETQGNGQLKLPQVIFVLGLILALRRHNPDTALLGTVQVCINPLILLVGVRGFEPPAPASRRW
jgi:hypothetical protein